MFEGMRVVVVTPAGRKPYLEILVRYILSLRSIVDEYRLWVNTDWQPDLEYMDELAKTYPDFIRLEKLSVGFAWNASIFSFFKNCVDENTIYVRFDDDIVCVDTKDAFASFLKFRKDNPEYFLVYATILNNAVVSHLQQTHGLLPTDQGIVGKNCLDPLGWENGWFAKYVHEHILSKESLIPFRMPNYRIDDFTRVSINTISWLGKDFAEFGGVVHKDEEEDLACHIPRRLNRPTAIFGDFVTVHYAFGPQRERVHFEPSILQRYLDRSIDLAV